jgi:CBS domain containing-hemolysin-like protein
MTFYLAGGVLIAAAAAAIFFATLSYALRDFSRARLSERIDRYGRGPAALDWVVDNARDLIFVTAVARMSANISMYVCVLRLMAFTSERLSIQYAWSILTAGVITLFASVAIPHAAARYAGETYIALCLPVLRVMRVAMLPVTKVSHAVDALFRRASGGMESDLQVLNEEIGEEILSVVDQGQKEGVVDPLERAMIESVIRFRETSAGQIMTPRPEMVTIELPATLADVRRIVEGSGHSRVPVFERSLDGGIVGVLYARDLLPYVGQGLDTSAFDLRTTVRPAYFVPETTALKDLLQEFRARKVHMAIILDEYGGTAGLVSIEDILEELVGDIRDEHEPAEPAQIQRVDEHTWEADARAYVDNVNAAVGLALPDDAGFDTIGGFVTTSLGRIPAAGTAFEQEGVRYLVLSAEPQRVTRVRIELPVPATAASDRSEPTPGGAG